MLAQISTVQNLQTPGSWWRNSEKVSQTRNKVCNSELQGIEEFSSRDSIKEEPPQQVQQKERRKSASRTKGSIAMKGHGFVREPRRRWRVKASSHQDFDNPMPTIVELLCRCAWTPPWRGTGLRPSTSGYETYEYRPRDRGVSSRGRGRAEGWVFEVRFLIFVDPIGNFPRSGDRDVENTIESWRRRNEPTETKREGGLLSRFLTRTNKLATSSKICFRSCVHVCTEVLSLDVHNYVGVIET